MYESRGDRLRYFAKSTDNKVIKKLVRSVINPSLFWSISDEVSHLLGDRDRLSIDNGLSKQSPRPTVL
jgi:hypothetical protein